MMINDEHFEKIVRFLDGIGIEVGFRILNDEDCFLPGFLIENGKIIIDRDKLLYPGDILHEAGHIAVVPAAERKSLTGNLIGGRPNAPAEEMTAIAWSYAACKYLEIDPSYVLHDQGYQGGGSAIVENFNNGNYFGVPVLQWLGMTTTDIKSGKPVYPAMIKWMRD